MLGVILTACSDAGPLAIPDPPRDLPASTLDQPPTATGASNSASTTTMAAPSSTISVPLSSDSHVLIIGDSISLGFTPGVQSLLKHPSPLVVHNDGNAQSTNHALSSNRLYTWLGDGDWDVIHFNFGLHDLAWADAAGAEVPVGTEGAGPRVPLDVYEAQLQEIVDILGPSGARLVWATTTPIYETSGSRQASAELAYNAVAAKVMERNGIEVNDLHAFALANIREKQRIGGTDNVHFTPAGYEVLAKQVAKSIDPTGADS